jgi:oxygen-independent coproporphyrinogen-3 oxidase
LYSLEMHPGTDLAAAEAEGRFRPAEEALEEDQYRAVARAAEGCGLEGYEVSNFAAPDQRCRHNRIYWRGGAYLGLGPGAHSFLPGAGQWGTRRWNEADLDGYLAALEQGQLPPGDGEELTREQALLERLFLALRCREPLDPGDLAALFGLDPGATAEVFRALEDKGLFEAVPGDLLRPARGALRRADGLALALHGRLLNNPGVP